MAADYTKTHRIVLLIDLNPLLHLHDSEPYLRTVLASLKTLVFFPPLRSSLFSFKPFFSSLSPILSSSKLPFPSLSLSFDLPEPTFQSLKSLLLNPALKQNLSKTSLLKPRGLNVAASMHQLVHDYAWDPLISCDAVNDGNIRDGYARIKSNLMVLFSPIVQSLGFSSQFLDVDVSDECLSDVGLFKSKFRNLFECVNDGFCNRDIHISWVDVKCDLGSELEFSSDVNKFEVKNVFFESGIRDLGWGFSSSDSLIFGSSLVDFGLIYPSIGVSSCLFDGKNNCSKASLSLEILGVSGNPLQCKCCDLQLISKEKNRFLGLFGDGPIKFSVKAVYRYQEPFRSEKLMDPILVREWFGEPAKDEMEKYIDFIASRALENLAREMGESVRRKGSPIWQILLSFLYRKGYWALVSFVDSNGDLQMGILKPYTIFSALLSIIQDFSYAQSKDQEFGVENLSPFVLKMDKQMCKDNMPAADEKFKRKNNKKESRLLQGLTWNDFCKAAATSNPIELEELYLDKECISSKKLKFLKCWMKQIEKSGNCNLMIKERSKPDKDIPTESEIRQFELPQESERPTSPSDPIGDESLTGMSRIQDDVVVDVCAETSEIFFSNLSNKIQQGLDSEGVDLGTLAERLVKSSIYWLYQKHEMEGTTEGHAPGTNNDDSCGYHVAVELTKLLLREAKELIAMNKINNMSTDTSNQLPTQFASENIVREYELQILFRMEILQSVAVARIEEPIKQKFVKQICFLLEAIQCHLEGGFFGDWSLDNYVLKIVKNRYSNTLEDVVHRIYTKMDLLLFPDEGEPSNNLLKSEESNQSGKREKKRDKMREKSRVNESLSLEDESHQPQEKNNDIPQGDKTAEQARKVIEAQERRERARRFASFTSWVPDLQRVWAPKQPNALKPISNRKASTRNDLKRATRDKVCETPMTGNKRSCSQGCSTDDEALQDSGTRLSGSVSKALFQDEWW